MPFVDVQVPEVVDVVDGAVARGGTAIVVPLFLSVGHHVRVDIAAAVWGRPAVAALALGPGPLLVEILLEAGADLVTAPIAPDPRLVDLALDRCAAGERELARQPATGPHPPR